MAGAFRLIGRGLIADNIIKGMDAADFKIKKIDPFEDKTKITFARREVSPYVNKLRLLWQSMRTDVIAHFPDAPVAKINVQDYLAEVEDKFVTDAYKQVKLAVEQVLEGANPGEVFEATHADWYLALLGPSVAAGMIKQSDLAGYRTGPVYIRKSKHTPRTCGYKISC